MSAWLTAAVALMLAGSVVSALAAGPTGQRRRPAVLTGAHVLWSIAGVLATVAMVTGVLRLTGDGLPKQAVTVAVVESFVGLLVTVVAVSLLGYSGLWARLRMVLRRMLDQR